MTRSRLWEHNLTQTGTPSPVANLPILRGPRVTLRRPVPADIESRLRLGRHPEIVRAYGGSRDGITPLSPAEEIRAIGAQPYAWVIDAGGFIGRVRFHALVARDRRASLAIGIDDVTKLGQGLGTEAMRLALGFAFDKGLHRIWLRVLASNARAIAAYRKCGFIEEGRERESAFVDGAWHDDILMGLLDRDFMPHPSSQDLRPITLSTDRLAIRPFVPNDADEILGAITPALTRFMGWEPPASAPDFARVWSHWLTALAVGTDLHATIRGKADGEVLGVVGLHGIDDAEPELGIWIKEVAHGHGFGREAVACVALWAADLFGVAAFAYPVAEANTSSRRLAEALGGTIIAERTTPKYKGLLYRIPAQPRSNASDARTVSVDRKNDRSRTS